MVLERSDVASARGQRILGKILGYGNASDAHHFTCPHPEGKGLETSDVASARGQRILGKILGYGNASDAHHFTCPHPEGKGLETAVNEALRQAGIAPGDLAFVNVHGTGTRENDRIEGRTLHRLLPDTPLWCTKGLTGHTLGAAGTIEAIFSLWALEKRCV